ncbi:MAG: nucleotidyl transferase AbiEii/AbiGii toxin family protein [Verrucomicrobia subdivision 3 bacterium]|nr:nucleotidyl transferase AbiEii/AbiGii toxin family protein [Limisphaerales bacterium]
MDAFARLPPDERRIYFDGAATARSFDPQIVEKDFWVCWTLKALFQLPEIGPHLIFKGGTSLSKVFKIIRRFSEDIDVSIDRAFLGFGGANEPEAGASNKEKQRRVEALKAACQQKIAAELHPALRAAVQSKLGTNAGWSLRNDEDDPDRQTLLFDYPSSFPTGAAGYIRRAVKIELGARADHWPFETRPVSPYVAEEFPQGFREPNCALKVLSVERTFWEKATILHAEFHRPPDKTMPSRFSRHYYDLHELIGAGVARNAEARLDLLQRVVEHKSLFFKSGWAKYGEAIKGQLRLAPPEFRIKALREDYAKMRQMFFEEPPAFEQMIEKLKVWELEINKAE